ncbi:MAG TPA: Gfo/Idh/MocA family oxidoreductase [Candidatus Solibacter sp.]|nr:Gfo/Idh/MocA family oxidoreductase [Candidatus Solibacter sp.]
MMRWLVLGIGDITVRRVIPAILEEKRSRLAAIVTRDPAKAEPYGVPAFTSLDEALDHGGFEAVYVATPVVLHAPLTLHALRSGMHVLCEKPMAMNFAEAKSMADTARNEGRTLGVAYYRRNYPKVQRAAELLRQGVIGQPVMAFATCHGGMPVQGVKRSWLLDPAQSGGGPLYDVGSHRIDLLNSFFGQPQDVRACLSNAVHKIPVEDSATVVIKYSGGLHAIIDVRWNSQVQRDEFRVIGTEGEMELSPLNGPSLVSPAGREDLPMHSNPHYPCIQNFVDAVLDGKQLLSSGDSALWTDWVTEIAVASEREPSSIVLDGGKKRTK